MNKTFSIVFALQLFGAATPAFAQTTPEEIAKLLGSPVKIEDATVFAASYGMFRDACGTHQLADIIGGIIRLEFQSLNAPNQEIYKSMVRKQHQGNVAIWNSLADARARYKFCQGLETSLESRAVEFERLHPSLFEKKIP